MGKLYELLTDAVKQTIRKKGEIAVVLSIYADGSAWVIVGGRLIVKAADEEELIAKMSAHLVKKQGATA